MHDAITANKKSCLSLNQFTATPSYSTMKSIAILCIAASIIAMVSAWPIKPDDKAQRIREAEEIAAKDLDVFKTAIKDSDRKKLSELTEDVI